MPPRDIDLPALDREGLWLPPWVSDVPEPDGDEAPGSPPAPLGVGHVLCAVDVHGLFVALSFHSCPAGWEIDELEVSLPKLAVPVRRGVPRMDPGASLPMPAPIGLRRSASGQVVEAIASPRSHRLDEPEIVLQRDPSSLDVSVLRR